MKHLVEYSSAPESDRFRIVDTAELSEIARQIAHNRPPIGTPEWHLAAYKTDLPAVYRALRLASEGCVILVARDDDGWFFATAAETADTGEG